MKKKSCPNSMVKIRHSGNNYIERIDWPVDSPWQLYERIGEIVGLNPESFVIKYFDDKRDAITIRKNGPFQEVLLAASAPTELVVHSTLEDVSSNKQPRLDKATCDGCSRDRTLFSVALSAGTVNERFEIIGIRYKSMMAYDYDLCSSCIRDTALSASRSPFRLVPPSEFLQPEKSAKTRTSLFGNSPSSGSCLFGVPSGQTFGNYTGPGQPLAGEDVIQG